jgi:hypothetical protein
MIVALTEQDYRSGTVKQKIQSMFKVPDTEQGSWDKFEFMRTGILEQCNGMDFEYVGCSKDEIDSIERQKKKGKFFPSRLKVGVFSHSAHHIEEPNFLRFDILILRDSNGLTIEHVMKHAPYRTQWPMFKIWLDPEFRRVYRESDELETRVFVCQKLKGQSFHINYADGQTKLLMVACIAILTCLKEYRHTGKLRDLIYIGAYPSNIYTLELLSMYPGAVDLYDPRFPKPECFKNITIHPVAVENEDFDESEVFIIDDRRTIDYDDGGFDEGVLDDNRLMLSLAKRYRGIYKFDVERTDKEMLMVIPLAKPLFVPFAPAGSREIRLLNDGGGNTLTVEKMKSLADYFDKQRSFSDTLNANTLVRDTYSQLIGPPRAEGYTIGQFDVTSSSIDDRFSLAMQHLYGKIVNPEPMNQLIPTKRILKP